MAKDVPFVVGDILIVQTSAAEDQIPVGSNRWQAWLEQAGSFAYEGSRGHFTARRQIRGGGAYWYAYVTTARQTRSAYLGRSIELSADRLEQAAARLHPELSTPLPHHVLPDEIASLEEAIRTQRGIVARRARRLIALLKDVSEAHADELAAADAEVGALQRALQAAQAHIDAQGTGEGRGEVF